MPLQQVEATGCTIAKLVARQSTHEHPEWFPAAVRPERRTIMTMRLRESELPHLCRALGVELRSKLAPNGQPYADSWLGPCLECGSEGEWAVNDGGQPTCHCLACVSAGRETAWHSYSVVRSRT